LDVTERCIGCQFIIYGSLKADKSWISLGARFRNDPYTFIEQPVLTLKRLCFCRFSWEGSSEDLSQCMWDISSQPIHILWT
jgi:hypothetical protein